jgi:hypothetical protein
MNPINEFIYEKSVERQIQLLRHREGLAKKVRTALTEHDNKFAEKIASRLLRLSSLDFRRLATAAGFETEALKDLLALINSITLSSKDALLGIIDNELNELSLSEYDFYKDISEEGARISGQDLSLVSITLATAKSYRKKELAVGQTQLELVNAWAIRRRAKVLQAIRRNSFSRDPSVVIRAISGTSSRFGGILKDTQFGAVLISNTLHPAATSAGLEAIKDKNEGAFDLLWSSILDSRTSSVCFSRHNKRIYRDLNGQKPPAHMNCRSRIVPIYGQEDEFPQETVTSWFKRQSEETQKKILGKTRYEAYKKKSSSLSFPRDFISRKGDLLTLEELRQAGKIKVT